MGQLLDNAIVFATKAHAGQVRKMKSIPYILHPMEVCAIVGTMSNNEELLAAAMLHDVVEDCGVTPEELEQNFGPRVKELVMMETEKKFPNLTLEQSWQERKSNSIEELRASTDLDVKRLWLADKVSNLRSFVLRYQVEGESFWQHFHQTDKSRQEWYYHSIWDCMDELADKPIYHEMKILMDRLFGGNE